MGRKWGHGVGANHDEERVGRPGGLRRVLARLAGARHDALEMLLPLGAEDLGEGQHLDVVLRRQLPDEVLRHALLQPRAPHENLHLGGIVGEEDGRLSGRVSAADDEAPLPNHGDGLGAGGPVEDAPAEEAVRPLHLEAAPVHARGQHNSSRRN